MRFAAATLALIAATAHAGLPEAPPDRHGLDPARLARIDEAVARAIEAKAIPGAVVLVARNGHVVHARAFGHRALVPEPEPMTRDTLFDLASLTKPVATATSAMILVERGKLKLDDELRTLLPEFDNHEKGAITVEQLLRHRAGFIPDNPLSDYQDGPEAAWRRLAEIDLKAAPGARFIYSDVGFLILGRIVEKVAGTPLDEFARREVFEPLGMTDTRFRPIREGGASDDADLARIAPTEPDEHGRMLRGVVHDPRARLLGGVAGHAGLFGTADDLAVYAQMLLDPGLLPSGRMPLHGKSVAAMIDSGDTPGGQRRGLGWDIATGYGAPRGDRFPLGSFGHTGFTGTSLWIDPASRITVVILTSRLHPDGKGPTPNRLRSEIATIVAEANVEPPAPEPDGERNLRPVHCGIDALIGREFDILKGRRVGLVTNHTGLARDGRSTIDVLHKAPGVDLVALFSPEHGIRGQLDRPVDDAKDEATGLPVFSLYGKTRKPTPESLEGVDVLVYDIQDIGARFYTYISTLGLLLESAKEKGISLVVLDRPNPIGGLAVGGPVREDEFESFIAHHALPVRHGMTVGELASLFNAERKIDAALTVVRCRGWKREDLYDRTGLLWVNPSPNMRSLTEALLYPGVGLLEATNLATGRGTDTPFERVGAPYIDPVRFATALNALEPPGVRFLPIRFRPTERQFKGEDCGGAFIQITDRARFDPIDLGLSLAVALRSEYRDQWNPDALLRFIADHATYDALLAGKSVAELKAGYQDGLDRFKRVRAKYLLYP